MNRVKVSKQIAYYLRHHPSGMEMDERGFVEMEELLEKLRERWPQLDKHDLQEIVDGDEKGRYEIRGGKIRAIYGHSLDVRPNLPKSYLQKLYHGTTPHALGPIMEEGLKPKGRQKVHLSKTPEEAIKVGKRRTNSPVVLEIDAGRAREMGVEIHRASKEVFVADAIPPSLLSIWDDKG